MRPSSVLCQRWFLSALHDRHICKRDELRGNCGPPELPPRTAAVSIFALIGHIVGQYINMLPPLGSNEAAALLSALIAAFILMAIRRIYLHPLSGFPGPKLAAATYWYTTYYEVWKDGKMVERIGELHRKYGTSSYHLSRPWPDTLSPLFGYTRSGGKNRP